MIAMFRKRRGLGGIRCGCRGELISIQKYAFPLYWVLIVDFSHWMAASRWIMMARRPT